MYSEVLHFKIFLEDVMEEALVRANERAVWYSRDEMVLSFHFVARYTKKIFDTYRDMFRFVLGLIDIGFKVM